MTNNVKPLLISHYAKNRGTTDYFVDYLSRNDYDFYYLRHPLPGSGLSHSELTHYKGSEIISNKIYRLTNVFQIDIFRELYLNSKITLILNLRHKINYVIGFGAINVVMSSILFSNKKVIFWGLDYSKDRFNNKYMNKFYEYTETIACKRAVYVIQPNDSQAKARQKFHGLNPCKVIISPNGVDLMHLKTLKKTSQSVGLIYIGTLSPQHGVFNFIENYLTASGLSLSIFGNGEEYEKINAYITQNKLKNIKLYGNKDQKYISEFIKVQEKRIVGIAPYITGDHGEYADSLKLKEYINYGLTYITTNVIPIQKALKQFGYTYDYDLDFKEAFSIKLNPTRREEVLSEFDWKYLIEKNVMNRMTN